MIYICVYMYTYPLRNFVNILKQSHHEIVYICLFSFCKGLTDETFVFLKLRLLDVKFKVVYGTEI